MDAWSFVLRKPGSHIGGITHHTSLYRWVQDLSWPPLPEGLSRSMRKVCLCVPYTASSRSVNAGHQQIQSDFWVKYNIERLQVFFWIVWTTALLHTFPQINIEKIVLPTVVLFWTFFIFWLKKILLKYFIMYLICLRIRG